MILPEEFGPFLTEQRKKHRLTQAQLAEELAVFLYCFPIYHVLQVWSPDYYTTGEVGKLLSIGSSKDRDTARLFLAQANAAFADLSTPYAELEAKHGLLQRYATASEREAVTQRHSLRLWSAHFDAADGYGYVWVCYSNSAYDADGEEVWDCRKVPSLWIFEKDAQGVWQLVRIKEHA